MFMFLFLQMCILDVYMYICIHSAGRTAAAALGPGRGPARGSGPRPPAGKSGARRVTHPPCQRPRERTEPPNPKP